MGDIEKIAEAIHKSFESMGYKWIYNFTTDEQEERIPTVEEIFTKIQELIDGVNKSNEEEYELHSGRIFVGKDRCSHNIGIQFDGIERML